MPSLSDYFTTQVDEVSAQLVALQIPLSLPAGPPAPDDPWAVPRPAAVDRTTLAWSTAALMLTHHHRTPLANQIPSADALLREQGTRGLAELHSDLHGGAPVDYRFTRCPYCDGLGEDPTLPTCQDLGCPTRHEHDGHPHLCPVCHGDDYQPQWHAEQQMAAMETLLADAIKDTTPRQPWRWPWPRHRSPRSRAE